jgi:hypothetical protein
MLTRIIMKHTRISLAFASFAALGLVHGLGAAVVIVDEDFSSLPVGEELGRSSWWGPSWNGGDVAYSTVNADGPDGVLAITKTTEVFAGRFYGGGLRDQPKPMPDFGGATVTPADVQISFWLKGESTQERGQIGFSIVSFDTDGETNTETGAAYYKVPIAPAEWTEISFTMADMLDGIPGHGLDGKAFDLGADLYQIFIWTRNEFETGWPIQENEGHKWSFSIAQLSMVADVEGGAPTWAGYPVVDGWVNTGEHLGRLQVELAPWVYSWSLGGYIYLPEDSVSETGSWAYFPR